MTDTRLWDRASLPVPADGSRRPEIEALRPGVPTVAELFDFMRDAELRFATLRMRIEEHTQAALGDQRVQIDLMLRHAASARVTSGPVGDPTGRAYEVWVSDGELVRTYAAAHQLGTQRPTRNRPRGLDDRDFPGTARVYQPLTPLPAETLADTFVHPAGYCQNVLATGVCWISGADRVAGREAIVLECDHPRAVESTVDRPDYHVQVAVDRLDGLILRLVESVGGEATRVAEVIHVEPDAALPATTFEFEFPEGTTLLY
jgi:hypothetical protein